MKKIFQLFFGAPEPWMGFGFLERGGKREGVEGLKLLLNRAILIVIQCNFLAFKSKVECGSYCMLKLVNRDIGLMTVICFVHSGTFPFSFQFICTCPFHCFYGYKE